MKYIHKCLKASINIVCHYLFMQNEFLGNNSTSLRWNEKDFTASSSSKKRSSLEHISKVVVNMKMYRKDQYNITLSCVRACCGYRSERTRMLDLGEDGGSWRADDAVEDMRFSYLQTEPDHQMRFSSCKLDSFEPIRGWIIGDLTCYSARFGTFSAVVETPVIRYPRSIFLIWFFRDWDHKRFQSTGLLLQMRNQ